ncbi:putative mitochondrial adenine nucleotide transporter BTL3, partial [Bienertia sinuspersici]
MLESELYNELEFFKFTNSTFFIKSSSSFLLHIPSNNSLTLPSDSLSSSSAPLRIHRRRQKHVDSEIRRRFADLLSISLSVKDTAADSSDGFSGDSTQLLGQNGDPNSDIVRVSEQLEEAKEEVKLKNYGAFNTTKHLWAGAFSAMVSRTFVAPLERLKLEYIVRHEQKDLFELIQTIAAKQGIKGFWKGNFVNILRTAPFKAINFYAYDTYRNNLCKLSGNEEATNFERFVAGAAAGITATLLCLPMDT